MPLIKITKSAVDAVPVPANGDVLYWDNSPLGPRGFGLRITPKGVRAYILQYRMRGRPARRLTIGQHGTWTAERARERAKDIMRDIDRGIDPVDAERKRARDATVLGFENYVETFSDGYLKTQWGDSWPQAKRQLIMHVVPLLGSRPLPEIEVHEITAVMDKLRDRPALQKNVHAVLRKLFNWAAKRDDIRYSPMEKMSVPPGVKRRKRILSPDELLALWRASYTLPGPRGAFIRMLMATLQRRSEVAELPWVELAQADKRWMLPGERAKNGQDHQVPLNPLAVAELEALGWKRRGFVFASSTGTTPISDFSKIKRKLDVAMLPILQIIADERADTAGENRHKVELPEWRVHDIRRTGTTQMQALGIAIEVTERVINHHDGGEASGIRAVYNLHQYTEEKRRALHAWGEFLERLITGAEARSNVVSLPLATKAQAT